MNVRIAFRGMEHSDSIEEYARKELEHKVFKLVWNEPEPIFFDLVLGAAKTHAHHQVELRLNSKHNHFIVKHEGADMYLVLDHVIKIIAEEVKKNKSKYLDKRNHAQNSNHKVNPNDVNPDSLPSDDDDDED